MYIRRYQSSDFETLQAWAKASGVGVFTKEMLPPTTYVLGIKDELVVTLSLMTTNSDRAYLEYALANPKYKGPARREAFKALVDYTEAQAHLMGYDKVMCLAPNESLNKYYQTFGYKPNLAGLSLMVKEIR